MELEMNLVSKMSAERLELEAGWIIEVINENLSRQEDAQLHHLLQHGGAARLHGDFIG